MANVITQDEVTVQRLMAHLVESDLSPIQLDEMELRLRTESGLGFRIRIEDQRKFIRLHTYLPTSKAKNQQEKLKFAHQLSTDIFLPTFCLDADGDVVVNYSFPYQYGLIADQFIALVRRFASLLEYLVQSYDTNGMFDFGDSTASDNSADPSQFPLVRPNGTLLN